MSSLTKKERDDLINTQAELIYKERNQAKAVEHLNDVLERTKNDYTVLNLLSDYFKAQAQRQSLTEYERKLSEIYTANLKQMIKENKLMIKKPIPFMTEEEYKQAKSAGKEKGGVAQSATSQAKPAGKVEAEIPADPQKTALVQASKAPPPTSKAKKTATKKQPQSAPLDTSRALQKAFADLYSDDPNALRVFYETLELAKGKSRKVTKKDIIALKPSLGYVGHKGLGTDKLIEIVKDSIGAFAINNNLPQIQKDWEATTGSMGYEQLKKQLLPEQQKEIEEHEKEKTQDEVEDIIMEKFKKNKNEQIADTFLKYNPATDTVRIKNIDFIPKHIKKTGYTSIQDSIVKSITEMAYITKYADEFDKVKDTEQFKQRTPVDKIQYLNSRIKHETTPKDLNDVVSDSDINKFYTGFYNFVMKGTKTEVDIHDINEATRAIKNLREEDLITIKETMMDFNKLVVDEAQIAFKPVEEFINRPADISVLPPKVKPSMVQPEDILTPLDRYNKEKGELMKKMKDDDYDKLKMRKNMGTATPAELATIQDIEDMKEALKKLEPAAKKEQAEKSSNISKRTTATKRSGKLRPHFLNPTEKAVEDAIGETVEEQINDIKNWYIFDLPEYSTGVGNKYENPLVKQNEEREMMLLDRTDIFSGLTTFLIEDGVDERKDFYMSSRPALTKESIGRGLFEVEVEETEKQFLQRFNEGSNGLFSQDITKKEVSDFKNIYQTPPDHIFNGNQNTGEKHKFEFTNNRGIKHTDKIWINNINLFYDGAPVLP